MLYKVIVYRSQIKHNCHHNFDLKHHNFSIAIKSYSSFNQLFYDELTDRIVMNYSYFNQMSFIIVAVTPTTERKPKLLVCSLRIIVNF